MRKPVTNITDSTGIWKDKTILIVEDVDSNYSYLAATLRKSGAKLLWAKNGEEAMGFVTADVYPDLVLMDVQLSGIDGYKVTKMIKEIHPNLPVIAQTAYAMLGEKEKSSLAGCDDYLPKPIRPGLLLETISKYL